MASLSPQTATVATCSGSRVCFQHGNLTLPQSLSAAGSTTTPPPPPSPPDSERKTHYRSYNMYKYHKHKSRQERKTNKSQTDAKQQTNSKKRAHDYHTKLSTLKLVRLPLPPRMTISDNAAPFSPPRRETEMRLYHLFYGRL